MLRQGTEGQSDPQALALIAMSHYRLGHQSEAQVRLVELRQTLDGGGSHHTQKWLWEAEQLLSQKGAGLCDVWTAIAAGRLDDATKLATDA